MNEMLPQILAELNLQPGQSQRVQVNEYQLEIRRPIVDESEFADMLMLEPWTDFPNSDHSIKVPVSFRPHPLPVAPEIPTDEEEPK